MIIGDYQCTSSSLKRTGVTILKILQTQAAADICVTKILKMVNVKLSI